MQLHLKRNETAGGLGGKRYDLFAQLELTPEEQERVQKADTKNMYLWEPDEGDAMKEGKRSRILGLVLAFVVFIFFSAVANPFIGLFLGVISWFPLSKLVFNQTRKGISVADIITGRTIQCKSMEELYVKETGIREKLKNFNNFIAGMPKLTGEGETVTFD